MVVKFSDTVQLGSILATVFVLVIAGLFTIRAKNAEWWRQSYEGVKAAHDEKALELREALSDLAAAKSRIAVLESLPNYESLSALLAAAVENGSSEHREIIRALAGIAAILEKIEKDMVRG